MRASGEWADILARDDVHEAYLDLTVATAGPDPGLADRAREEFDFVVKVQADYPRAETDQQSRAGRALDELYADYHRDTTGVEAPEHLMEAFRSLLEEASVAAP